MKKVVIISDTHGMLRDKVKLECQNADWLIHAGDVTDHRILEQLKDYAPVTVVRGNNDKTLSELPLVDNVQIDKIKFLVVHQKKDIPNNFEKADIVVYGHSHKFHDEQKDGVLYLNPGSCGKRRFGLPITMVIMMIDGDSYSYKMIDVTE